MTPQPVTPSAAAVSAVAKLTARELTALRAQVRRELRDELAADLAAKRARARAGRELETPALAAAARRMIAAVGKRAATDVESLAELAALRDVVDAAMVDAIDQARQGAGLNHGARYSWADVARVLGLSSRQAAQQRYGK